MKKNNKNRNKFDLGKVSGGLSLSGGITSGGALNLVDKSKDIKDDKKTGVVNKKDTTVGIFIDADVSM